MRYLRLGPTAKPCSSRPPLILIHGLLGYSFSWRHNFEVLAREREVLAVDLLGIGHSDRPSPGSVDFGCHATAKRMLEWLEALDLKNVDLLGTSHGGTVAMMMAALDREQRRSSIVRRLVLVAPANPWSHFGAKRIAFFSSKPGRWLARLALASFTKRHQAICSLVLRRMYGDPSRITPDTFNGYARMSALPGTIEYTLGVVRSWNDDMRELKRRIPMLADTPALLVWGNRDLAVAPRSAQALAANLKNSKLILMKDVGHMPYEEAPKEFNRLVLDFLDRDSTLIGQDQSTFLVSSSKRLNIAM